MSTVIVETPEGEDSTSNDGVVAAAEANAHIAEVAEESAEEAAAISHGAAEVSIDAATASAEGAAVADSAAADAVVAASQSEDARDDIHATLRTFKDELLAGIAALAHHAAPPAEDTSGGLIDIEIAPEVVPDSAPTEQHPYYKKWGKR